MMEPMPQSTLAARTDRAGALATLRPGDAVDGVFACTRKERLLARNGAPYLAVELRDRSGALPARVFRDADLQGGRFDRGELVRVSRAGRALPRADPARARPHRARGGASSTRRRSCRSPTATSTSSTASSSTSRARSPSPATGGCSTRLLADDELRRGVAPRAVHARRPPRLPRRAARAHRRGGDAGAGAGARAPAPEQRPAAVRGDRARHRQDARVHLRGDDRAQRGGPPASGTSRSGCA